jgi:ABC-type transporter Mla subunit MlaD
MIDTISLSLLSDAVIAVLLLATIAYTIRLTTYLANFKKSRKELETIVKELSTHIDKADKAVQTLHDTVDDCSADLERRMNQATNMFDELDIIVQTGDSLANRLETIATRSRRIVEGGHSDVDDLAEKTSALSQSDKEAAGIFAIRDPEIEKGGIASSAGFTIDDDEVLSEAERDLYAAMQKTKDRKEKASS